MIASVVPSDPRSRVARLAKRGFDLLAGSLLLVATAPVLGNRVTFEGIEIRKDYPLLVANEAEMLPLIRDPERFRDRFERAAAMGLQIVREHHDPVRVDKAWRETAVAAMGRRHVTKAPF